MPALAAQDGEVTGAAPTGNVSLFRKSLNMVSGPRPAGKGAACCAWRRLLPTQQQPARYLASGAFSTPG